MKKPAGHALSESKGFTLIELLVVLGILAILMLLGIASLNAYAKTQSLKNAAKEIRTNLRFAQSKAIVQEKPTSCTGALTSYNLEFTSSQGYIIKVMCTSEITVASYKLPTDVTKTSGAAQISFAVGTGRVGSTLSITLTSSFAGSETINIDSNGIIK